MKACQYLSPDDILKGELDESVTRVQDALKMLHAFRDCYEQHKAKLETYFEVSCFKVF